MRESSRLLLKEEGLHCGGCAQIREVAAVRRPLQLGGRVFDAVLRDLEGNEGGPEP